MHGVLKQGEAYLPDSLDRFKSIMQSDHDAARQHSVDDAWRCHGQQGCMGRHTARLHAVSELICQLSIVRAAYKWLAAQAILVLLLLCSHMIIFAGGAVPAQVPLAPGHMTSQPCPCKQK